MRKGDITDVDVGKFFFGLVAALLGFLALTTFNDFKDAVVKLDDSIIQLTEQMSRMDTRLTVLEDRDERRE